MMWMKGKIENKINKELSFIAGLEDDTLYHTSRAYPSLFMRGIRESSKFSKWVRDTLLFCSLIFDANNDVFNSKIYKI